MKYFEFQFKLCYSWSPTQTKYYICVYFSNASLVKVDGVDHSQWGIRNQRLKIDLITPQV